MEGPFWIAMTSAPDIRVVTIEYGTIPLASRLNHKMAEDSPVLHATLDVRWNETDPASAVLRFQSALSIFSSSLGKHECRGPEAYHVAPGGAPREGSSSTAGPRGAQPFDAGLGLAHLVEHVMIDFQCSVTDAKRCSGITGAHRKNPGRYDVMVECPDYAVGRCCLGLALSAVSAATSGSCPGGTEKDILQAARLAYSRRLHGLTALDLARIYGWSESRATRALHALQDVGYLSERRHTVNFSGVTDFRVANS